MPPGPVWPGERGRAWRVGDWPGISAGSLCPSGQGSCPRSSPVPQDGSSCLPLLITLTSILCPQVPTRPGGGLGGPGIDLGAPQAPWAQMGGAIAFAPLPLFPESSSHLPLLISPASGMPILSGLHFSSPLSPPTSYLFTLGFLPPPWASEFPTSGRQAP